MPKIQIRSGIFETNSSSVHSVTIATEDLFRAWQNGEVMFKPSEWRMDQGEAFLPTAEALKKNIETVDEHFERDGVPELETYRKALEEALKAGQSLDFHLVDFNAFVEVDVWYDGFYISYGDYWATVERMEYEGIEETTTVLGSDAKVVRFGYTGTNY